MASSPIFFPAELPELLKAGVGDNLVVEGRTYPVAMVGESNTPEGFATREFSLGLDRDFYLVVEGPLASGNPEQCRAVLTHELNGNEVQLAQKNGPRLSVAEVLKRSSEEPAEVIYQQQRYRFLRRSAAQYRNPGRDCARITWDYERPGRNLAIELWPEGETAVYEGRIIALERIGVLHDHRPNPAPSQGIPAEVGVLVSILSMILGAILTFL